ncbi:hypothetical protein IAU60_004013 [Kwoniella sp. DSM 27419]
MYGTHYYNSVTLGDLAGPSTPHTGGFGSTAALGYEQPYGEMGYDPPTSPQEDMIWEPECLGARTVHYLAVDTNIFISHLNMMRTLHDLLASTNPPGLILLIPSVVIHELDGLTRSLKQPDPAHPETLGQIARTCNKFLLAVNKERRESGRGALRCQALAERWDPGVKDHGTGDDKILDGCLYFAHHGAKVTLWTNDQNLSVKAESNDIPTVGGKGMTLRGLLRATKEDFPQTLWAAVERLEGVGVSGVAQDEMEMELDEDILPVGAGPWHLDDAIDPTTDTVPKVPHAAAPDSAGHHLTDHVDDFPAPIELGEGTEEPRYPYLHPAYTTPANSTLTSASASTSTSTLARTTENPTPHPYDSLATTYRLGPANQATSTASPSASAPADRASPGPGSHPRPHDPPLTSLQLSLRLATLGLISHCGTAIPHPVDSHSVIPSLIAALNSLETTVARQGDAPDSSPRLGLIRAIGDINTVQRYIQYHLPPASPLSPLGADRALAVRPDKQGLRKVRTREVVDALIRFMRSCDGWGVEAGADLPRAIEQLEKMV